MSHSADPNKLLEVLGDELRPVVRDDPRPLVGIPFSRPLDDRLDFGFGHALADLPVDEKAAAAIEQAAEVEEGAGDVDVRDIDVPVFMHAERLLKAFALERGFAVVCPYQSGVIRCPLS